MTWISTLTTAFGLVLLAHACYSAQEYATLESFRSAAGAQPTSTSLPLDISIETVVALFVTSLGLVLGTQNLRPIEWHVWAGKIEREGQDGARTTDGEVAKDFVGNPFRFLETRPGFIDIRKQRKEFGDWARTAGGK